VSQNALHLLMVGIEPPDVSLFRELLRKSMGMGAARYQLAPAAEDGLRKLMKTSFDLVVIDEQCANGSLQALISQFRSLDAKVPILLLSKSRDESFVVNAMLAGATEIIPMGDLSQARLLHAVQYSLLIRKKMTEYKQAEDQLRRLSRAVEQSADTVVITDLQGHIEYANPAFYELTGFNRTEVIGKTPNILKSGEQNAVFYRQLWNTIKEGKVFRGVLINKKKDGALFFAEKTITPVRDAEGRITHFISNDRDISERRKLEAQLLQSQKMDAIGQLAGGVAHDFNNLLMVISSYAELALDHLDPEHPLQRNLHEILKASRSAADITRQLLTFGRKQLQSLQAVDINTVLEDIGRMLPRLIGEDIKLSIFPGSHLGRVKADAVQLEQVVLNLAVNARDAMPKGGELTIETSSVVLDDAYIHQKPIVPAGVYTLLTVSDSGKGIPAEDLPHIFEPFFTTKDHEKGTGLGLAIVYGIVKQSGGFIWVYSERGQGTTFKIYLPSLEKSTLASLPAALGKDTPLTGSETVLFAEDDSAVRNATTGFLRSVGYAVLEARDGAEAIQIAEQHPGTIDLMIADVVMPGMSGCQAAEEARKLHPEMKVLYVSGYADRTLEKHGIRNDTSAFLQKPYTLKMLGWKLRSLLTADEQPGVAAVTPVS